jgi:hypothetical protein
LHIGTCWWIFGKGFALTDYSDWTPWPLKRMASPSCQRHSVTFQKTWIVNFALLCRFIQHLWRHALHAWEEAWVVLEGDMGIFRPSHSCGMISHFSTVYLWPVRKSGETTCSM